MTTHPTLKFFTAIIFMALFASTSCKRSDSDILPPSDDPSTTIVDDAPQVLASVSGIVVDENNVPITGAIITIGNTTRSTNSLGMFSLTDISLSKQNGSVSVKKFGYFKAVRTFKTSAGKDHSIKIQLTPRTITRIINTADGGTININAGATINFPANGFMNSDGTLHTGAAVIYSRWIDPTASNLSSIIPGDLRGIATNGRENILVTYGMVGAEIEDIFGNELKIATGKTASITFPIPPSLNATAPDSIALWHFDDNTARWKEEGKAVKINASYTAQVNKFSTWNCDIGLSSLVRLDYKLINQTTNSPLVSTLTRFRTVLSNAVVYNITNNEGFVSGLVPRDEPLLLEVMAAGCVTPIFSKTIGPFSSNTSLGSISVNLPTSLYTQFTGKIVNCTSSPISNAFLSLYAQGGISGYAKTDEAGNFSFSVLNCSGNTLQYSYMGTDNTSGKQSTILNGTSNNNLVNLGALTICTVIPPNSIFIAGFESFLGTGNNIAKVWKNGVATNLTDGSLNSFATDVYVSGTDVYATGSERFNSTSFSINRVWKNGSVLYTLSDGMSYAETNSIVVSGNDVYVAGRSNYEAKVWKNGVPLYNLGTGSMAPTEMKIIGNDVYVVGHDLNSGKIWKNGILLPNWNINCRLQSLFVKGADIYAVGTQYDGSKAIAKLWKNGVETTLHNGPTDSEAKAVFVEGSDVYVSGTIRNSIGFYTVATIWKNGIATPLTNGSGYGSANDIKVIGNDVYVVGTDNAPDGNLGNTALVLWKNNLPSYINDRAITDAYSPSFFIK